MDKLSSKHLIFIILGLGVVSMKTYPDLIVVYGKNDSWLAVAASSVAILLMVLLITSVCKKNDCYNILTIYQNAAGKYLGTFLIILFLITLFLSLIECSAVSTNVFHSTSMVETPQWFFLLFIILPALYPLRSNRTAFMTLVIVAITLVFISGINLAVLTQKYKKVKYLFPVMANGISTDLLIAVVKSTGFYSFVAVIICFLDDVYSKKSIIKTSFWGVVILAQMQIFCMAGTLMTFDYRRMLNISYPKLQQSQLVNYFGFLESGEFFVLFQTYTGWFIKYLLIFFAVIKILKYLHMDNRYAVYVISALVYVLSVLILESQLMLFILLNYFIFISIVNFIIIPVIVFLIYWMKNFNNNIN